jgi:peptidoglycan/LPS O-acetylase OafA/YrhL
MRRVLRIWPVYFVVLLVGFVLFPFLKAAVDGGIYAETANPWMYIAFLSNFDQIIQHELPMGVGLGPTWSVAVEEQFYLIWPIFLIFFKKSKFITPILITIIASIILSLVFKLPSKHTVLCSIYLATGGIFGYLMFYKKPLIDRVVQFLNKIFPLVIGLLVGLMFVSTKIDYSGYVLLFLAISVVMGLIIIQQCSDEKYQIRKIPFLERVGKYTYGLYLYHVICNFVINTLLLQILGIEESILLVVFVRPTLSLALSGIISYLSYHYFEKKFLAIKSKFR